MYHPILLDDILHYLQLSSPHMVQTICIAKIIKPYYVSFLSQYHGQAPNLLQQFSLEEVDVIYQSLYCCSALHSLTML
jgi:hypothetical protein